ncbi:hypothetical protein QE152_g34338 [Popillia japonica]|uniref:Uncharacterized protein n=1 Tax=Popillia japonica TaxID=7064 RepID=A0AAW1IU30_POPJA
MKRKQEIADLRRECLRLRRAAQRHRNGNEAETIEIEHREAKRELRRAINRSKALCWKQVTEEVNAETIAIEHREAKRELRRAINRSKALCWKQVTEEANADPWGLGY